MTDPQAAPNGWAIDTSTGTPILTYEACSVIQDEQAHLVMDLLGRAAEPQAAPLVPPMPKWPSDGCNRAHPHEWVEGVCDGSVFRSIEKHQRYTKALEDHARTLTEIAQAQAQKADEAEARESFLQRVMDESRHKLTTEVYAERDALQARVVELLAELKLAQEREGGPYKVCDKGHIFNSLLGGECPYCERRDLRATLAQRDREISVLRESLQRIEGHTAPGNAPVNKQWVNAIANNALAATAQAGAEAERRIREDEREKWVALIRWLNGEADDFPARPEKVEGKPWPLYWWRTELMHRVAAILGTGGEARS